MTVSKDKIFTEFARGIILIILLCVLAPVANTESKKPIRSISFGVQSQYQWWYLEKRIYSYYPDWWPGNHWGADSDEDGTSDLQLMIGPVVEVQYGRFKFKNTALIGNRVDFATNVHEPNPDNEEEAYGYKAYGSGKRMSLASDLSYGGKIIEGYLGYRYYKSTITRWKSGLISTHAVSDVVIGGKLHGFGGKSNGSFNWTRTSLDFSMGVGIQSLLHLFNNESFVEHPIVAESQFNLTHNFSKFPMTIEIGYSLAVYSYPIPGTRDPWYTWLNVGHGANLSLRYHTPW